MVQMNQFAGQKLRHGCREQMYGHPGGKVAGGGGGGVMYWAIEIDMYTLMCRKLMTNKKLLYKKINKIKFKNSNKNQKKEKEKTTYGMGKNIANNATDKGLISKIYK